MLYYYIGLATKRLRVLSLPNDKSRNHLVTKPIYLYADIIYHFFFQTKKFNAAMYILWSLDTDLSVIYASNYMHIQKLCQLYLPIYLRTSRYCNTVVSLQRNIPHLLLVKSSVICLLKLLVYRELCIKVCNLA